MIATKNEQASVPGEYIMEVRETEGGEILRTVKVYVTAEAVGGLIKYRCTPTIVSGDGEESLNVLPYEMTIQHDTECCPRKALNQALEAAALMAHRAKSQIDTLREMGLPTPTATE